VLVAAEVVAPGVAKWRHSLVAAVTPELPSVPAVLLVAAETAVEETAARD
jgi:hypothetical protein